MGRKAAVNFERVMKLKKGSVSGHYQLPSGLDGDCLERHLVTLFKDVSSDAKKHELNEIYQQVMELNPALNKEIKERKVEENVNNQYNILLGVTSEYNIDDILYFCLRHKMAYALDRARLGRLEKELNLIQGIQWVPSPETEERIRQMLSSKIAYNPHFFSEGALMSQYVKKKYRQPTVEFEVDNQIPVGLISRRYTLPENYTEELLEEIVREGQYHCLRKQYSTLKMLYNAILDLNPELKTTVNKHQLQRCETIIISGVCSRFNINDIIYFCKRKLEDIASDNERIPKLSLRLGVKKIRWVPSPETEKTLCDIFLNYDRGGSYITPKISSGPEERRDTSRTKMVLAM